MLFRLVDPQNRDLRHAAVLSGSEANQRRVKMSQLIVQLSPSLYQAFSLILLAYHNFGKKSTTRQKEQDAGCSVTIDVRPKVQKKAIESVRIKLPHSNSNERTQSLQIVQHSIKKEQEIFTPRANNKNLFRAALPTSKGYRPCVSPISHFKASLWPFHHREAVILNSLLLG